jgi:polysaccharide pyruvyl transferase WcaK-like protein
MAHYRSYRDKNSRDVAAGLLRGAARDPVVPDMALSLPSSELPQPAGIRSISRGRLVVAISPIAYAKPGSWAYEDAALYDRYLGQMAGLLSQLLERGYFLLIVCSSIGDDDRVVAEILKHLDDKSKQTAAQQMYVPRIRTWKDLLASLLEVDFLIASRLHSVILGFLTGTPTVAISFDPKVDWLMEDLDQTEYLLHFRDFTASDVVEAFDRIKLRRDVIVEQIAAYRQRIVSVSERQYHTLADLALAGKRCHV